jgi:hypothetical protein
MAGYNGKMSLFSSFCIIEFVSAFFGKVINIWSNSCSKRSLVDDVSHKVASVSLEERTRDALLSNQVTAASLSWKQ